MNLNLIESELHKKLNFNDLAIFILPVLIFSLYLFVYNPGVLTIESFAQLHQIATGEFTNTFPIFHTFFEIICLKICSSPILIGFVQIIVFSLIWMIICKYHRDESNNKALLLQFIITLVISLIPINAVNSITLSSNILFSYALLLLCFLIKVMVDNNGQISDRLIILLALTMVGVGVLSTYGVYVALITLIIIVLYLYLKEASARTILRISAITIVCILLITSLNNIYDIHQDKVNIPSNDAFENGINLEEARNQYFSTTSDTPTEDFENSTSVNAGDGKYGMVDSFVNFTRENPIINLLFNNSTLYLIFSIILIAFIYVTTKNEEMILVLIPVILNVIISLITGKINLYSCLLFVYLLIIIITGNRFREDLKPQTIIKSEEIIENNDLSIEQEVNKTEQITEIEQLPIEPESENIVLNDVNELLDESLNEDYLKIDENMSDLEFTLDGGSSTTEKKSDLVEEILKEIEMDKK